MSRTDLARAVLRRPGLREQVVRAIFDEDAASLARLLADLGFPAAAAAGLIAEPGIFLPSCVGWT